ncbi:hypothetical protein [Yoonia sp.]|uniref:hypothetical protein n=1 Tax=Yoonia sp. TaxID=2212373 RepID=UPI00358E316A
MPQLNLSTDPQWLDFGHGVQIRVAPMIAARKEAQRQIYMPEEASGDGADLGTILYTNDIALTTAKAIARIAITGRSGVGDERGDPVPVSREDIEAPLDI